MSGTFVYAHYILLRVFHIFDNYPVIRIFEKNVYFEVKSKYYNLKFCIESNVLYFVLYFSLYIEVKFVANTIGSRDFFERGYWYIL